MSTPVCYHQNFLEKVKIVFPFRKHFIKEHQFKLEIQNLFFWSYTLSKYNDYRDNQALPGKKIFAA